MKKNLNIHHVREVECLENEPSNFKYKNTLKEDPYLAFENLNQNNMGPIINNSEERNLIPEGNIEEGINNNNNEEINNVEEELNDEEINIEENINMDNENNQNNVRNTVENIN